MLSTHVTHVALAPSLASPNSVKRHDPGIVRSELVLSWFGLELMWLVPRYSATPLAASRYLLWRINKRHSRSARGPGRNGETMNNELLSGTQRRFTEQSSQYEASLTEVYCVTPTTRMHDNARTLEERDKFNPIPLDLYSYNPGPDAQQATAARKILFSQ